MAMLPNENQIVDTPKPPESRVSVRVAGRGRKLNRTLLLVIAL